MVFCGSFTSSPAVETASRPMKEKKIVPAAVATPAKPERREVGEVVGVEGGERDDENIASTASLITTMIALTLADSLAPRISSSAHSATSTTAGRLMMPGVGVPRRGEDRVRQLDAEEVVAAAR